MLIMNFQRCFTDSKAFSSHASPPVWQRVLSSWRQCLGGTTRPRLPLCWRWKFCGMELLYTESVGWQLSCFFLLRTSFQECPKPGNWSLGRREAALISEEEAPGSTGTCGEAVTGPCWLTLPSCLCRAQRGTAGQAEKRATCQAWGDA